ERQAPPASYSSALSAVPPLFSRAVALGTARGALVQVSGTASILGSRSVHPGDARAQTLTTLENIEHLLSNRNLARHGLCGSSGGPRLMYAVVYVRHRADHESVRRSCEERLPAGLPTVYVRADVCRPELLVEIEAVAQLGPDDAVAGARDDR